MAKTDPPEYQVSWSEADQVVEMVVHGRTEAEMAQRITGAILEMLAQHPGSGNVIIDVSDNSFVSTKARRVFEDFNRRSEVHRVAFIGASLYIRVIVNFVNTATRTPTKTKFFRGRSEAVRWLKEK